MRFKEASEAYEILSDKDKKLKYDQYGHAGVDPSYGGAGGYGGGFGGFSGGFDDLDLGDIFGNFFGGGGRGRSRNAPRQGASIQKDVMLSFEDAAFGCTKDIKVDNCTSCSGSGAEKGTNPEACSTCGGSGQVRTTQRTPFGSFASTAACSKCNGTGKVIKHPCKTCNGTGKESKSKTISINIPAGIDAD